LVDLSDARDHDDIVARLRKRAESTKPGEWIVATPVGEPHYFIRRNWRDLAERRLPDRWTLDRASTDHPIFIEAWGPTTPNVCAFNSTGLKRIGNFEISVAGYPEKHPDSPTLEADLDNLKAKVDAGATRVITQFFFDNAHYLRFLEAARARGIWAPIVPGIVPIHDFKRVAGFAARCGASMPAWLARRFDGLDQDQATTHLVAAAVAAEQVMDLVDEGIRQFHFYTLNRADLVYAICHLLGLRPESGPGPVAHKEAVNA